MAKKKGVKEKLKEEKGKEEANVYGKVGEEKKLTFPELLSQWGEHQKQMLRLTTEMMNFHQQGYGNMWDKWLDFSTDTSRNLAKIVGSGGKRTPELYELWGDCSEKLTEKIKSATKKNISVHLESMEKWREVNDLIGKVLVQSMQMKTDQGALDELRTKYTEFTEYLTRITSESGEDALSDFEEIQTTLYEFIGKMNDLVNEISKEDESYEKMTAKWEAMSSEMTKEVTKIVESATKQYTDSQEVLGGMFSTMMRSAELFFYPKK